MEKSSPFDAPEFAMCRAPKKNVPFRIVPTTSEFARVRSDFQDQLARVNDYLTQFEGTPQAVMDKLRSSSRSVLNEELDKLKKMLDEAPKIPQLEKCKQMVGELVGEKLETKRQVTLMERAIAKVKRAKHVMLELTGRLQSRLSTPPVSPFASKKSEGFQDIPGCSYSNADSRSSRSSSKSSKSSSKSSSSLKSFSKSSSKSPFSSKSPSSKSASSKSSFSFNFPTSTSKTSTSTFAIIGNYFTGKEEEKKKKGLKGEFTSFLSSINSKSLPNLLKFMNR